MIKIEPNGEFGQALLSSQRRSTPSSPLRHHKSCAVQPVQAPHSHPVPLQWFLSSPLRLAWGLGSHHDARIAKVVRACRFQVGRIRQRFFLTSVGRGSPKQDTSNTWSSLSTPISSMRVSLLERLPNNYPQQTRTRRRCVSLCECRGPTWAKRCPSRHLLDQDRWAAAAKQGELSCNHIRK